MAFRTASSSTAVTATTKVSDGTDTLLVNTDGSLVRFALPAGATLVRKESGQIATATATIIHTVTTGKTFHVLGFSLQGYGAAANPVIKVRLRDASDVKIVEFWAAGASPTTITFDIAVFLFKDGDMTMAAGEDFTGLTDGGNTATYITVWGYEV